MRILTLLLLAFTLSACSRIYNAANLDIARVTIMNKPVVLGEYVVLHPDCSPNGEAIVRVLTAPDNGEIKIVKEKSYTQYHRLNPMSDCNKKQSMVVKAYFYPKMGFAGRDKTQLDIIFPNGQAANTTYHIDVR